MAKLSKELAEKVLDAHTRNAITNVSEQKTLSAGDKVAITKAALPQTVQQQMRAAALLRKYCKGDRLSADELEEIKPMLESGGEDTEAAPVPPIDTAVAGAFKLDAEPKRRTGLKYGLPHYAALYDVAVDTIKNWREKGKKKGESPPLDDPAALAKWWSRNMEWRIPDGILAAQVQAVASAPVEAAVPAEKVMPSATAETPPAASAPPPAQQSGAVPGMLVDITSLVLEKDAEVQQAAALLAGTNQLMTKALNGLGGDPVLTQRNWERAQEVYRKVRKYAEERALRARDLLPREAVEHDLAKLAEQLRSIDESMERRVMELCPNLPPEARAEVSGALRKVSMQRKRALENIETTTDDFTLAAA